MSHISHHTVSTPRRNWIEWLTLGLISRSQPRTKQRRNPTNTQRNIARRKNGNTMYELMKKGPAADH